VGQVAAALVTGNTVLAKPAEQTPAVAREAVKLLHAAGVPADALQQLHGPGETVGAALVAAPLVAGVVFTGSAQVAKIIQLALAQKDGPIVPLIAETGGINAMLVESTALPEQVADAMVQSAFRSAGQRCSALRLMCKSFGGEGLSGTGPKAGGPHYLLRFCAEQTLTINTTAAGGNVALYSQ